MLHLHIGPLVRKELLNSFVHWICQVLDGICFYCFAWGQNTLPELLLRCELPPAIIDTPFDDAPEVLNGIEVRGAWGPHHKFVPFYAHSSQRCRCVLCSMRWCIIMHENDLSAECMVLLLEPWQEVLFEKLHIHYGGHLYPFRDPKGADNLSPHDSSPKHYSTSSLLVP